MISVQILFAVLTFIIGTIGCIFLALALRRLGRLAQMRAAKSKLENPGATAQIPLVERTVCYVAIGLVILSILAFRWSPADEPGMDIRILATATGVAALSYIVWFSVRWWHLKKPGSA